MNDQRSVRTHAGRVSGGARSTGAIFAAPAVIGASSTAGVIVALLDDGILDWFGWATLAVPVAAVAWAIKTKRR